MSKHQVRHEALRSRRALSTDAIAELSREVQGRFLQLPEYGRAATIASYVAKSDEVQTQGLISAALKAGKRVIVPRSDPKSTRLHFSEIRSLAELSTGSFGVLEPPMGGKEVGLNEAQVAVVPIVAWDASGYRLGYGKGYFDRELGGRGGCLAVGLALESQRVESLPRTRTDVRLDVIVTESRTLRFGGEALD